MLEGIGFRALLSHTGFRGLGFRGALSVSGALRTTARRIGLGVWGFRVLGV